MEHTQRIVWVDYFKTISIFLIVFSHASLNNKCITEFLFTFHVPLFFFASGYLEHTKQCNTRQYLKKYIYSLLIPFTIWNLLFLPFNLPVSLNSIVSIVYGKSLGNLASWFLLVLFAIKILSLSLRNRNLFVTIILLTSFYLASHYNIYNYDANQIAMYIPFFFVAMYGKKFINNTYEYLKSKVFFSFSIFLVSCLALIICFNYTNIPHTGMTIDFKPVFYLYWVTGFLGIIALMGLSMCFANIKYNRNIVSISTGTLFLMCSHYEIVHPVTSYISKSTSDFFSILFVVAYFVSQCALLHIVFNYIPILAGRKKIVRTAF